MRVQAPAARSLQLQFVPLRRAWLRSFADRREFVRSVGSCIPSESAPLPERRAPASAGIIRLKRNSRGANARHQPQFDACSKDAASWITTSDHQLGSPCCTTTQVHTLGAIRSLGSKSQKSDSKPTATLPRMLPLSPCCPPTRGWATSMRPDPRSEGSGLGCPGLPVTVWATLTTHSHRAYRHAEPRKSAAEAGFLFMHVLVPSRE